MRRYILVRALQAVLSLFLLSIIIFVVVRLTGDPLTLLLSEEATEEDRLALEAALEVWPETSTPPRSAFS